MQTYLKKALHQNLHFILVKKCPSKTSDRRWEKDKNTVAERSRAVVPNLGCVRNLKGYARFKYYAEMNNIYFQKPLRVLKILYLCLGVREYKKVRNHWFRALCNASSNWFAKCTFFVGLVFYLDWTKNKG